MELSSKIKYQAKKISGHDYIYIYIYIYMCVCVCVCVIMATIGSKWLMQFLLKDLST